MDIQSELYALRDNIREEERNKGGRAVNVCGDGAIIEMAKNLPRELDELGAIDGIGKTFIDKYGERFVKLINDYIHKQAKVFKANSAVVNTLKELEKKLVNLNKANKLLYISRTAPKSVIDITEVCDANDVISLLFKEKRRLKLCDLQVSDKIEFKLNESNYNKFTALLREINRDFREKGTYDLYIGYPFVKGTVAHESFDFNAPLALFPVKLVKETNYYVLSNDDSRDVVYNDSLLLALNKFLGIRKALPHNVVEELTRANFFDELKEFYKKNGLELIGGESAPEKFSADVAKSGGKRNVFAIACHIVIGKFSTYSSSIQKDINEIIERLEINDLLKDLLQGIGDIDMYGEDMLASGEILDENDKIQERELKYINALNSTQENILIANTKSKEMVVQGPPGTGKSQVITSLIASAVLSNKNVLMVSEKKSALDVVYSRLGNLSKYALLIDDVNDKDSFYSQLKVLTDDKTADNSDTDNSVSTEIDKYMYALTIIADKMCDTTKYGVEIYKLYQMFPRWKLDENERVKLYKAVAREIQPFKGMRYGELIKITTMYKNQALDDKLARYIDIIDEMPIITDFSDTISSTAIIANIDTLETKIAEYKAADKLSLFKRNKARGIAIKPIKNVLNTMGLSTDKSFIEAIIKGEIDIISAMSAYDEYIDSKQLYDKLLPEARQYFKAIYKLTKSLDMTIPKANELALKYIVNEYLSDFESDNRTTLHNINNYNGVLDTLSKLLESKINVTKASLYKDLNESLKFVTCSKRKGDIKRVIDSKRRWSIKKFTDKFSYEMLRGIRIWLLTPEVVSEIMPLVNGLFDLVIFDEASQMYVEKAIPAIMRAKSVIIAGDSKQLRPSNLGVARFDIDEDDSEEEGDNIAALEEESLLDVARFKYPPVMLDFHYRSKYEELIAFSNYAFYGGKLNVAPNPIKPDRPPIEVINVEGGCWTDRRNEQEAKRVVELIKNILTTRKNRETLGVITFNSQQRDYIMDLIDETAKTDKEFYKAVTKEMERKDNGEDTGLFIKNIENVQGDERDIIIFSIGYAKNARGKLVKQFGWLNQRGGENRLNVAISRAKLKVMIVKSISAAEFDVGECKNNGPLYLRKYLQYAEAVSEGDTELAKRVLLSFVSDTRRAKSAESGLPRIAKQLRHELERRGYEVDENVGIGNYNIDMAIAKNGVYKLGIEFDSSVYDTSRNTRERDYHRWNYFKLRGWNMYRVWSSAWWENPGLELGRILNRLKQS